MTSLIDAFRSPSAEYRGKPFWAWNGRLEPDELVRQIHVMHRMGLGGFFMHSRVGLDTEYLGPDWFTCVRACVEAARELGMEAWMYDEDRWPSGAAGAKVTCDKQYRQRCLRLRIGTSAKAGRGEEHLATFSGKVRTHRVRDLRRHSSGRVPDGHHRLVFSVALAPEMSWYNGATYLDTMNPKAVERFVQVTHEAYRREIGDDFGPLVPGVFTDEPNHGGTMGEGREHGCAVIEIPWTPALPRVFRKRYGYDLIPHLPELFLDVDGVAHSKARHDYHDCTTHLFADSFGRIIGQWCAKNKVQYTGHVLAEETLRSQTSVAGSAMRFYEHMQAPGIDILTQFGREYSTAKQCASVQHQMGRTWMLSELYGCTGWDFTFEGHKAIGDWQAAMGVNLRCQHLSWYTMLGEAKRDYPASISFQSSWWRDYPAVEDYFARVGVLLTRGSPVRRVLVVHPVESVWLLCRRGVYEDPEVQQIERQFEQVQNWLLEEHLDFDYGDEEMMSRLSRVRKGAGGRPVVRVGQADYTCVVVPPVCTLRSSTVAMLRAFARAGGPVVFADHLPELVDCEPSDAPARLGKQAQVVPMRRDALAKAIGPDHRTVSIADARGRQLRPALYMLRRDGDTHVLFVCNTDRKHAYQDVHITLDATGPVTQWDASTGQVYRAHAKHDRTGTHITTSLPASGSRLFVIGDTGVTARPAPRERTEARRQSLPSGPWDVARNEPNVLVLDRPRFRIRDGEWQGPDEILRVDRAVRDACGLPHRGGNMVQPWARKPDTRDLRCPVELVYTFDVDVLPAAPMHLVVEQPERFDMAVNGQAIAPDQQEGWWVDNAMKRVCVAPWLLKAGRNEVCLRVDFRPSDGLEAIFLTGEFGVRVRDTATRLVAVPDQLREGDWVTQGLPFYAGSLTYSRQVHLKPRRGERAFLVLPKHAATAVKVRLDGRPVGILPWPPYEIDLGAKATGKHLLEIELLASRRNAMGPLHLVDPDPTWTGPVQFITTGNQWCDTYHLKPCGLLSVPVISYRR